MAADAAVIAADAVAIAAAGSRRILTKVAGRPDRGGPRSFSGPFHFFPFSPGHRAGILPLLVAMLCVAPGGEVHGQSLDDRIEGLFVGALVGDAVGAPTEFAPPVRGPWTRSDTTYSDRAAQELARSFKIAPSLRGEEPFGPWSSGPGTLTDDSRFKVMFFDHLEFDRGPGRLAFARSLLAFEQRRGSGHGTLPAEWLEEFKYPAYWVLGDSVRGRPLERQWGGLATMAGQMPFLPVAALLPGEPEAAYRLAWELNFLDSGYGKDVTSALVAGLSAALAPGATWDTLEAAMRETDPFGFSEVPWVPRRVEEWISLARDTARDSRHVPAALYRLLENRLDARTWWEAWVPLVVVFSAAELADYEPLPTMQLIQEFGHDTDSYLQLAGAIFGALHGPDVFPVELRVTVQQSLLNDYGDSVERWMRLSQEYRSR